MYDILIIVILFLSFILGLKKGFVKTAFSMLSLVVSSLLVYFLYDHFLGYFASSEGGKLISQYIAENYNGIFSEQISAVVVSAAALVLLYFIVKILLKFLVGILELLSKLPLINTLNKFLGGAIGLVFGAIVVVIITNIACVIPSVSPYVESSKIVEATSILFVSVV